MIEGAPDARRAHPLLLVHKATAMAGSALRQPHLMPAATEVPPAEVQTMEAPTTENPMKPRIVALTVC